MLPVERVIGEEGLAACPDGLRIAMRLPWYRSLPFSTVEVAQLAIDGVPVDLTSARVEYEGQSWSLAEMAEQTDAFWFVRDSAFLLLPGRAADCPDELESLMEGYTFFRDFPSSGLRLFESLRVMRIVHFTAWCARQIRDGGAARLDPAFATDGWWAREVVELEQHIQRAYEDL